LIQNEAKDQGGEKRPENDFIALKEINVPSWVLPVQNLSTA
jgi:hypothetical protein